jgi:hypothetical protein
MDITMKDCKQTSSTGIMMGTVWSYREVMKTNISTQRVRMNITHIPQHCEGQ